jgi:L-glutamine-phosphate cytidylyltransferase
MRAIILAAGRGSRMGMLTDQHPKCLTRLAGKPLLNWQLEALHMAGIVDIGIVRGYKSEMISRPGYTGFQNPRWAETNMVVSLGCAGDWLTSETCIVSYSDIVYHPDVVKALMVANGDLVITYDRLWDGLWAERFADPLSDAETFQVGEDGALLEIGRRAKCREDIQGQYMGLLKFTPAGWRQVCSFLNLISQAQRDKLDMTGLLRNLLQEGVSIRTKAVDGRWCEVDCEQDVRVYESRLQSGNPWKHDWRF